MAQQGANQVRLDAVLAPPRSERAPEIVRRARRDTGASAGRSQIAADVAPGAEEQAAFTLAVGHRVLEQRNRKRDHWHPPIGIVRLRAAQPEHVPFEVDVAPAGRVRLAPAGARREYERDTCGAVRLELSEQRLSLRGRQETFTRLVLSGKLVGHHGGDVARELAAPLGDFQRAPEDRELFVNRVPRCALSEPLVYETVDDTRGHLMQRQVRTKNTSHVPRLHPIAIEGTLRSPLELAIAEQAAQRFF